VPYSNITQDDTRSAEERDIPLAHRRYTCPFSSTTEALFRLPLNVKVCNVVNDTDRKLYFYVTKYDGSADTPAGNLHTANTSSRIEEVAAGASFPIAQHEEFNSIRFKADGGAATGTVTLRPGHGYANEIADIETRALVAVV